jgi:hypothetical protein
VKQLQFPKDLQNCCILLSFNRIILASCNPCISLPFVLCSGCRVDPKKLCDVTSVSGSAPSSVGLAVLVASGVSPRRRVKGNQHRGKLAWDDLVAGLIERARDTDHRCQYPKTSYENALLQTCANLLHKTVLTADKNGCPCCGTALETAAHIMFACSFAQRFWTSIDVSCPATLLAADGMCGRTGTVSSSFVSWCGVFSPYLMVLIMWGPFLLNAQIYLFEEQIWLFLSYTRIKSTWNYNRSAIRNYRATHLLFLWSPQMNIFTKIYNHVDHIPMYTWNRF